ncbi:MAG: chemotaxis protein CheA [Solirubrobacteraceae bacterium]|jgi:two-component system chemotaxis sensor kinase CheA
MDSAEYLPMFLAESREHLQELNVAIVALEKNPQDADGVDAIFRVAHSVKGMTGTMGFSGMARLSHEMEEVFELVRRRRGGVERDLIDAVFACLDALSAAVDSIELSGEERIDPEPLIERLRALVGRSARQEVSGKAIATVGYPGALRARVEFAQDVLMPSVIAYVLLTALRERGTVLGSDPADEDLDGWDGRVVEVVCGADFAQADIEAVAADTDGVIRVTITRYPDDGGDGEDANAEQLPLTGDPHTVQIPAADSAHVAAAEPAAAEPEAVGPVAAEPEGVAGDPVAGEAAKPEVAETDAAASRPAARTVRVDAERLDQLMYYMGELVVHRTQLASLVAHSEVPGIAQAMQELERTSQALRAMVMKVRMIEVEAVFSRLPRLVRDLAAKLGKDVELRISGADTELDRTVVDALGDPLVHLVRNALDHGLETPQERVAAGKPATGLLEVSARHGGGRVVITVRDDGRGIDVAAVAARARRRGLVSTGDELSSAQAIDLLFTAGFSTADRMTDISGRGVGMDAARDAVRALGGDVLLQSEPGAGMVAEIRLPLTLAITSALIVEVSGLPFAIPLDRVEWTLSLGEASVRKAAGQDLLVLPDGVVALCDGPWVLAGEENGAVEHAVIVRAGDELVALAVGELIGQRELVTRPLPPELEMSRPISAGAVLAEGAIALIVDCDRLIDEVPREVAASALSAA